jgi:hypothetical protein
LIKKITLLLAMLIISQITWAREQEDIQIETKLLPSYQELSKLKREEYHKKIKELMIESFKYGAMFKDSMGKYYTNGRYKFELKEKLDSSSSLFSHIEYKMSDNARYNIYSHPISLSEEGRYKVIFRGIDKLDNVSDDNIYDIIVDTTPPIVKYQLVGEHYENEGKIYYKPGVKIEASAEDDNSGVFEILLNVEDNNKKDGDGKYKGLGNLPYSDSQKEFFEHGEHTVYLRAFDRVMNLSQKKEVNFTVDAVGPNKVFHKIVPATREIDAKDYCYVDSRLYLYAEDAGSGVYLLQYSFSPDKEWKDYKNKITVTGKDPIFKVYYRAMDNLGNLSSVSEYSCNLDLVPPKSNIKLLKDK